jgi:DNA repair protein RecO (recombination protein O)
MIWSTKGIVLRTVKYGETSIIASVYTQAFGIQSYMVNGVRTTGRGSRAHFFQPSSILDMQVYHNELRNLQRIKDLKWSIIYRNLLSDVTKNAVALYMVEMLQKCLKQPEANSDLFLFCEDAFLQLDTADPAVTGNFPIYFSMQLAPFLGFRLLDNYSPDHTFFDFREGNFSSIKEAPDADPGTGYAISQLLKAMHPLDLREISISRNMRRTILKNMESFYGWHSPDFGVMKTLPVLSAVLD